MRVLVCGDRNMTDIDLMNRTLHAMFDVDDTVTLIHGDARGADRLSEQALTDYFNGGFVVERYPADWNKYGRAAGSIRNKQMLDQGKPDFVVAFLATNSKGTKDMIEQANKYNVPVKLISI